MEERRWNTIIEDNGKLIKPLEKTMKKQGGQP
jgi:hypothetical protein